MITPDLPLYAQLKHTFVNQIISGQWQPGERLPSHRNLGTHYGVSYMTVRRAIEALVRDGYLYSVPGKGTFVAISEKQQAEEGPFISFTQDMQRRGMVASSRLISSGMITASISLAHIMRVAIGTPLNMLSRLRLANDEPIAIQVAYLPYNRFPDLLSHDFSRQSLYAVLQETYHVIFGGSISAVEATLANDDEARLLGLTMPSALLVTEQTTQDEQGSVFEYVRSAYRADRYKMSLQSSKGSAV
jgi:GntR family transcriptional regulator